MHDACETLKIQKKSTYPDPGYLNWFGPSGKLVENSEKLICLEMFRYQIGKIQYYGFKNLKSVLVERFRNIYIM